MKLYFMSVALVACFFAPPAFAYIDPGMGSMWIQALIAFLAGFGVTLRIYWQRLKNFFSKNKNQNLLDEASDENQDESK